MSHFLVEFAAIIRSHTVKTETGPGQKAVERYELLLLDGSRLVTYESRKGTKFKYSYQWMTAANETIYRWDNTPHFPEFVTYPYHRHVGADELAEQFSFVTLRDVLTFIAQRLTSD